MALYYTSSKRAELHQSGESLNFQQKGNC